MFPIMHYVTNVEVLSLQDDAATVRAMFYNPMQLPGMSFVNPPTG